MKVLVSKVDASDADYTSLVSWEAATQDTGGDSLAVAVVRPKSDAEYQTFLNALGLGLEELIQNYLLVHSSGKVLAYKVGKEFMQCAYGKGFFEKSVSEPPAYQQTIKEFVAEKYSQYEAKVFICHASEDKNDVILPLTVSLDHEGIDYWVDSVAIKLGDSITQKVNEGLRQADYFVVVLSQSFVGKPWPERELNAVLNMDATSGQRRIIPVLVGSPEEQSKILYNYPLLNDVYYYVWQNDPQEFISLLKQRIARDVRNQ